MSFINKFERDSIYEEMEGPSRSSGNRIVSKLTTSVLLLAIGFSSGSIYSTFNSNKEAESKENIATEVLLTNSTIPASGNVSNNTQNIIQNPSTSHSIKGIVKACADSVVEIKIETTSSFYTYEYTSEGNGSGVIISEDGYILTNNHVIDGANKIFVSLRDGNEYEAKLIGKDSKTDTAVIKVEANNLKYAVLGNSSLLEVGDLAVVIGNPLGELGGTVTSGIISALEREIEIDGKKMNLIQTDAGVNPGNSGGGLFNAKGELVGIVTAKSSGINVENLGFAIPINDIDTVIDDLLEHGYATNRAFLGVSMRDTSYSSSNPYDSFGSIFSLLYGQMQYGAYVDSVLEDSPAEKGGIKSGDIIVSVDGNVVSTAAEVTAAITNCDVGSEIEIGLIRENKTKTVKVTLEEYKGQ